MNSKKKIIETLKKADKASVERLMEEQTRKEAVFARVQRKAADHNEYTDVAEGVEKGLIKFVGNTCVYNKVSV